jgi:hypothetical protein
VELALTSLSITNLSEGFDGPVHVLRGLVRRDGLPALIEEAIEGPPRRVHVHGGDRTWEQRFVRTGGALWSTMAQNRVTVLACALMGAPIGNVRAWTNRYAAGERISWHKDGAGDIQLLLLLAAPHSPDMSLRLRGKAGPRQFPLAHGDALLFSASRVEHETLASADATPRISAVMRFFRAENASGERQCAEAE